VTAAAKSILVVEDDPDVRESLAAVLEGEGHRVLEAEHGLEALERLRANDDVCIILLDLFMPTMNGWAFRDEQLRDPKLAAIPVVVITADASAAAGVGRLGVTETMTKPIDFERLFALIDAHC
jgi:CheY-like chemotaxis protein